MVSKILVISGHVSSADITPDYISIVKSNHASYAQKHGYGYEFFSELPSEASLDIDRVGDSFVFYSWGKVFWCLSSLLKESNYDYVFWIDSDSLFINMECSLDDLVSYDKELVFTGDSYDVFNTGHFLFKRSNWSLLFLREWLAYREIIPCPRPNTTHIAKDGFLVDQPAANILLSAGSVVRPTKMTHFFNRINGYIGNKNAVPFFSYIFAPTNAIRCFCASLLISKRLRSYIKIVNQDRLNSYPFNLPGYKKKKRDELLIEHYPGNQKHLIVAIARSLNK